MDAGELNDRHHVHNVVPTEASTVGRRRFVNQAAAARVRSARGSPPDGDHPRSRRGPHPGARRLLPLIPRRHHVG